MGARLRAGVFILCFVCASRHGATQGKRDLAVEPAGARRRVALVLGNASYPGRRLANPTHDADDMERALQRVGFTVTKGVDLGLRDMQQRVDQLVQSVRAGDVALFYFSGHGMQIDGENLLVPVDYPDPPEARAKDACIRLESVQKALEQTPARLMILITDSCRNNPYRRNRSWARGMAAAEAGLGSYVAFAAAPGQTADDNPGERNGLFTKFLLASLAQPPPLSQIFRGVRDAVYSASDSRQQPYLVDQVIGDFLFEKRPEQKQPAPAAGTDQLLEEGLGLFHHGDCAAAMERFDRVVREDPENAFAQNAAGMAHVCRSEYSLAVTRFNMAIHLQPSLAAAYLNRGQAYLASAKFELAAEDFTWAIDQEPENAVYYDRRGEANFGLRKYDEAMADFNTAVELNPADAEAYHGRGQVEQRLGRDTAALEDFTAALERKSNFREAQQDLEALRQRLGRK